VVWLGTFDTAVERQSGVTQTAGECERETVSKRERESERKTMSEQE
jgi:hypothetical protein